MGTRGTCPGPRIVYFSRGPSWLWRANFWNPLCHLSGAVTVINLLILAVAVQNRNNREVTRELHDPSETQCIVSYEHWIWLAGQIDFLILFKASLLGEMFLTLFLTLTLGSTGIQLLLSWILALIIFWSNQLYRWTYYSFQPCMLTLLP